MDVLCLDSYSWTDVLDIFKLPHYTNEHRGPQPMMLSEVREVIVTSDEIDADDQPIKDKRLLLVVWPATEPRPTDEQIDAYLLVRASMD